MARPFRIGAKVVWVVRATRANQPNSETGRAAVNVRLVASVDDVLQRHGTPSQTEPASTPEAIWDQQSSGGPSEKYQCTGALDMRQSSTQRAVVEFTFNVTGILDR